MQQKNIVDKLTRDTGNMFVVEHILNKNQKEHETLWMVLVFLNQRNGAVGESNSGMSSI